MINVRLDLPPIDVVQDHLAQYARVMLAYVDCYPVDKVVFKGSLDKLV
jgi:hypothetical protein